MSQRQHLARGIALIGLVAATTGCIPQGLAFKVDKRLTFQSPEDRATVSLPLTLDWDIRDFEITGLAGEPREDAGYFAVFLDSTPMPPGRMLRWIARKDTSCRPADGCPDEEYLIARGIYTTTDTELVLDQLPRTGGDDDRDRRERHRATIVLLNARGERIGESAFEVVFDVDRKVQP